MMNNDERKYENGEQNSHNQHERLGGHGEKRGYGERGERGGYGKHGGHGERGGHGEHGGREEYGGRGERGGHGKLGGRGEHGGHGERGGRGEYGGHGKHGGYGKHGCGEHGEHRGHGGCEGYQGNGERLDRGEYGPGEHHGRGGGRHGRGEHQEFGKHGEHGCHGQGNQERCGGGRRRGREFLEEFEQSDDLLGLLRSCSHILRHQAGRGSGSGQGRILHILYRCEEISQKELQSILQIQPGSLSEILTKLENKGLIERSKDDEDKRVTTVRITEAGKETVNLHGLEKSDRKEELFSALDENQQEELKKLLQILLEDWKKDRE